MIDSRAIDTVLLHADDNVCVAARELPSGTSITAGGQTVRVAENVRLGHKIALVRIATGQPVVKYGQIIGFATADIAPGDWVHGHNLSAGAFERDYRAASEIPPDPAPLVGRTFQGFRRP